MEEKIFDLDRDAERLIIKAQNNGHGYLTKKELEAHALMTSVKQKLLNYNLIIANSDNPTIYYLTERGNNFKSFSDEKQKHERELYLKKWAYWRSKYWIVLVIISFIIGSIITPILIDIWKTDHQVQRKTILKDTTAK